MRTLSAPRARRASALLLAIGTFLSSACADQTPQHITSPSASAHLAASRAEDVAAAIAAQERHNAAFFNIPGVIGTAVGLLPNGNAAIRVYVTRSDVPGLPPAVDGIPVDMRVTAQFMALSTPTLIRPSSAVYARSKRQTPRRDAFTGP